MQKTFFSHDKTFFFKNWNLLKKLFFWKSKSWQPAAFFWVADSAQRDGEILSQIDDPLYTGEYLGLKYYGSLRSNSPNTFLRPVVPGL